MEECANRLDQGNGRDQMLEAGLDQSPDIRGSAHIDDRLVQGYGRGVLGMRKGWTNCWV